MCGHLSGTHQNDKHKRKEERHPLPSLGLLGNRVGPLAVHMQICKKGDTVDIKGMGTAQKETPPKCYHGKAGRIHPITQHAIGMVMKQAC